jgi:esterase/lipase superfamily enzyme
MNEVVLNKYSRLEDLWSATIHGIGIVLGVAILTLLVTFASIYNNVWSIVSTAIFGTSMIILYTASTLYHAVKSDNHRKILIVVGQGAWEEPLVASTKRLEAVLHQKGIHGQVEYWGFDVDHNWPWWFKMCEVYVPEFL